MQEFLILFILIEGDDRDSIFELVSERVDCIIYDHYILQVPALFKDAQIFHIDTISRTDTTVSVESHVENLMVGVYQVKDNICVGLMTGCEDHNLEKFACSPETFHSEGSNVKTSSSSFPIREIDCDHSIADLVLVVLHTMD